MGNSTIRRAFCTAVLVFLATTVFVAGCSQHGGGVGAVDRLAIEEEGDSDISLQEATGTIPALRNWPQDLPKTISTDEYAELARGAQAILRVLEAVSSTGQPHLTKCLVKREVTKIDALSRRPTADANGRLTNINDWLDKRPETREWVEMWWDRSRSRVVHLQGFQTLGQNTATTQPTEPEPEPGDPTLDPPSDDSADVETQQLQQQEGSPATTKVMETDGLSDAEEAALNSVVEELEDPPEEEDDEE